MAMGSRAAPAYANTFLGNLENKFLNNETLKPIYYKRFIDDIFMIFPHSPEHLNTFINNMNQIHPSMKFTFEYSREKITYLDTDVHVNQSLPSKLFVTTHIKSTNKQAYTHATSFHPPGTGKGIAVGEAIRYARTNTFQSDFDNSITQHIRQMNVRGYTSEYITTAIQAVKHNYRHRTHLPKVNKRPVFVTRFSTSASKVIKTIRHNWHYIREDPTVGKFFPHYPIMAFKKNANLKRILVRARIKPDDLTHMGDIQLQLAHQPITDLPIADLMHPPKNKISFCPIQRCFLHKYLSKSLRITSTTTNRSFRVRGQFTCNTKNVIYLIQCKNCRKQYVGQTSTCIRHRISQHVNNKSSTSSTVDQHFAIPGHTMLVQPIEQITTNSTDSTATIRDKLYQRERYWIDKFKCVYPQGLNWTAGRLPHSTNS